MNPVRRLMLAGAGVIAGGALVAIGSRLSWASATLRPSPVAVPGFPRIVLAGGGITLDGSALGAGYLFGLGLLIALVPLGWLVTGPRARVALALVAVAICAGVFVGTFRTRSELTDRATEVARREIVIPGTIARISSGPGVAVTAAGAALAAIAALAGASVAGRAPRLGLPERPPGGPEQNGQR